MPGTRLPPDIAAAVALGSEAGRTFAEFNWDDHPLGPVAEWPDALRTVVTVALASRFPVVLWLGDDLTMVYNDGYIPMLADKHPQAMGMPGLDVWWEIRDIIEPMLAGVVETGVATWSDDLLLMLVDRGRPWERYFTFTYSPIFLHEGKVGGVFCAVFETTERVVGERRLQVLNTLGAALVDAKSVDETLSATVKMCAEQPADLPFVALYLEDGTGGQTLRASTPNVSVLLESAAPSAQFWGARAVDEAGGRVIDDLQERLPGLADVWRQGGPERALVMPLTDPSSTVAVGTAVIGLNPHRPLDDQYQGFCRLLADQIIAGITSAGAYEAERARAESLAELDRAKTLFLTNVSHELRTPLTLILGPAEDALALGDDPELRELLQVVARNGRRLLRLVNSLLDFARIEAGRASTQLVETDVGELTADIASAFGDICRRAGLDLVIDCKPAVGQVDPYMWETIVFNLLSNAFKFTFDGSISVQVAAGPDGTISMSVSDTGVGIPEGELARVFERFYRPLNVEGRSMEGSGIGLALVQNLVELHGGSISVTSRPGAGTTFTVTVPAMSHTHVHTAHTRPSRARRDSIYVTEAAQWLEGASGEVVGDALSAASVDRLPDRPIVLVADDNTDLRAHLERIIGSRWSTVSASDGQQALELIRRIEPDLVIADVMMPKLDGFELIKAIRADPRLESIPVMILSARAGLEATGEGFEAGADDYILKPFKSTELLNRVAARLKVAIRDQDRREREQLEVARAAVLVELGSQLSAATTEAEIVTRLLGPALSALAMDAVAIGVVQEGGDLLRMTYGGSLAPVLLDLYHTISVDAPVPMAKAVRTARSMVVPDTMQLDETYAAVVSDAAGSVRAVVVEPLVAVDGVVAGALCLMWAAPREFSDAEVDLFKEIAGMTARALERVRRAERDRRVAVALQDRLLDWGAHSMAAAISTTYRPASDIMRVGGDWYTITALGDTGKIALSVGDVVGHGLPAAMVMSELRSALAVAALAAGQPGEVLDLLEDYARQVPGASCTTAAYVLVDPAEGTVRYACAGHPYPVLVTSSGDVRLLEDGRRAALAVGSSLRTDSDRRQHVTQGVAPLEPGSLLVLYTDGLIERRGESIDSGFDRLVDAARTCAAKPVGEVCAYLLSALAGHGGYDDDVALVAFRPCGSTSTSFVDAFASQVSEIPGVRSRLRTWLEAQHVDAEVAYEVLVCVGEAVANAAEHGNRFDPNKTVTLEVFLSNGDITATVTDAGRWDADSADTRRLASRGRGLTLIHGLCDDVVVDRNPLGTRVTTRHRMGSRVRGTA